MNIYIVASTHYQAAYDMHSLTHSLTRRPWLTHEMHGRAFKMGLLVCHEHVATHQNHILQCICIPAVAVAEM